MHNKSIHCFVRLSIGNAFNNINLTYSSDTLQVLMFFWPTVSGLRFFIDVVILVFIRYWYGWPGAEKTWIYKYSRIWYVNTDTWTSKTKGLNFYFSNFISNWFCFWVFTHIYCIKSNVKTLNILFLLQFGEMSPFSQEIIISKTYNYS